MRCIGTLGDAKQLETFVAFLVTHNISAHIDRDGGEPKIWIKNEDDVAAAQQLLTRFAANPDAAEFANVLERASEILRNEAKKRTEARKLVRSFSSQMRLSPTYRAPLTLGLTALCVVLWFLQTFSASAPGRAQSDPTSRMVRTPTFQALTFTAIPPPVLRSLRDLSAENVKVRAYNILHGEVWRSVSPIFIHFGVAHLLFNLLALYQLGRVLENRYGTLYLGLSILVIAVVSNVLQATMPEQLGGSPLAVSVDNGLYQWRILHEAGLFSEDGGGLEPWGFSIFGGISGVVFGLLGIAWMKSRFDWSAGFYVPRATVIWAIAWFFLGVSSLDQQLLGAEMANWAHGAGLVLGVIIGYLTSTRHSPRKTKSP